MLRQKDTVFKIKNLNKVFNIQSQTFYALKNLNFEIFEGEVLGVVGESGSGKSTLGKIICGLYSKTSGEITYRGEILPKEYKNTDFKKYSKEIQFIFQNPYSSINPRMTVFEILSEGISQVRKIKGNELKKEVVYWLKKVGLIEEHLNRYPHEFSGGQKQRIGIARALAVKPRVLICDEPISALDVSVQAQIVNLLIDIKNELGITLVFIAHDLSMVRFISDRVLVLNHGELVEIGETEKVYSSNETYTKMLLDSALEADPEIERNRRIHKAG